MDMLKNWIKKILKKGPSFDEAVFWGVLYFSILAAIASAVFTVFENLGMVTEISSIGIAIFLIVLGFIAKKVENKSACFMAMAFAVNTVLVPPMFFFCGGFQSGMPFYCLTAMFVVALTKNPVHRIILFVHGILVYSGIFWYADIHPELVAAMEPEMTFSDRLVSFIFMSFTMLTIISYLLIAYNREHKGKDEVIAQLNYLSTHDPLTKLVNRRRFIDFLNNDIRPARKGYYLLMFDIDNFKKINDTLSHVFGDTVLTKIAETATSLRRHDRNELTVRYGGEEFIQVIKAESLESALATANYIRTSIAETKFPEHPDLRVTISGGLVDCADPSFDTHGKMLERVDVLLYLAKARGKNQIVSKVE